MTFENVTIEKKANQYFDGQVTSRTINFPNGERKTLGIMMPGEYEFGTESAEIMEITSGDVDILKLESSDWEKYTDGTEFSVPEHSSFRIKVNKVTDYCCSYI